MDNLKNYLSEEELREILAIPDIVTKSYKLVCILFKDKTDKEGRPYIEHLVRVSSNMSTPSGKCLGLLHDVVEDIPRITFEDLQEFGIPDDVISALRLVTHTYSTKDMTRKEKISIYDAEIDKIINSGNSLAIELKYWDMSDNYNKERLILLSPELQSWFKDKYEHNLIKLERKRKEEIK